MVIVLGIAYIEEIELTTFFHLEYKFQPIRAKEISKLSDKSQQISDAFISRHIYGITGSPATGIRACTARTRSTEVHAETMFQFSSNKF